MKEKGILGLRFEKMKAVMLLQALVLFVLGVSSNAQSTTIQFSIDTGPGLIYFLMILFFILNVVTPIMQWLYVFYLSKAADYAGKEMQKISKKMSDRMSDAGRKVSQRIRP
jgi:hypothetical protein